jgi:type IV pilus assembly protein PilZ
LAGRIGAARRTHALGQTARGYGSRAVDKACGTLAGHSHAGRTMQMGQARQAILPVTIRDKTALYSAYMPSIRGGGLFIPTSQAFRLGDEIFLLVELQEEGERLPVSGKVVWITPTGAQSGGAAGVGVQFTDGPDGETARAKIETLLATMLNSDRPTHTI